MVRRKRINHGVPENSTMETCAEARVAYATTGSALGSAENSGRKFKLPRSGRKISKRGLVAQPGSPQAVLRAIGAAPHLAKEDVDDLVRLIGRKSEGQFRNPLA